MSLPVQALAAGDLQEARDVADLLAALAACRDVSDPTPSSDGWMSAVINGVAAAFNPAPEIPSCEMRITGPGEEAQTTAFVCEGGIPGFETLTTASTADDVRSTLSAFADVIRRSFEADGAQIDTLDAQRAELAHICAALLHSDGPMAQRLRNGAILRVRNVGDGDIRLIVEVRGAPVATLRSPGISRIFGTMPTVLMVGRVGDAHDPIWSIQSVGGFMRSTDLPVRSPVDLAATLRTDAARALTGAEMETER